MPLDTQMAHPFISYCWHLFSRAFAETRDIVQSPKVWGIIISLLLNAAAILVHYIRTGWGGVADRVRFFFSLVAANIAVLILVFCVNLGRAPYLLYRDQGAQITEKDRIIADQKRNLGEHGKTSIPPTPVPPSQPKADRLKGKISKLSQEMRSFLEQREKQRPRGAAVAEQVEYDAETGRKYRSVFKTHANYVAQIMRASGILTADDFYCIGGGADAPLPKPSQIGQCADYLERVVNLAEDRDWGAQVRELKQKVRNLCRDLREFNQTFERQELAINSRFTHTPDDSLLQERTMRMKAHGDEYLVAYSPQVLDYRSRLLAALYIYDKELNNDQPPEPIATMRVRSTSDLDAVVRYLTHLVDMLPQ